MTEENAKAFHRAAADFDAAFDREFKSEPDAVTVGRMREAAHWAAKALAPEVKQLKVELTKARAETERLKSQLASALNQR